MKNEIQQVIKNAAAYILKKTQNRFLSFLNTIEEQKSPAAHRGFKK